MIVKNEEEFIGRCLNSAKDIVDEIIIVDTGSNDKTIEICKGYQAQIIEFNWNDSFADARNFGVEKATGDWILWLDADEEIDKDDIQRFYEGGHFSNYDVLTIHLVNYYGDEIEKDKTTDIAHTRLFRRGLGIKFINKIHETLDVYKVPDDRIGHLEVKVHHYGYLNPIVEKKDKYQRNIRMLNNQIIEGENTHWAYYYIAMEHYRNQQFKEAFEKVNLSIKEYLIKKALPHSMVYKLKYSILIAMGSFDGAWPGIEKAIILYPDYVDLRFFKGIILYYLANYELAIKTFEECIEMGEGNINYLILRGVGSFQAWHYKGLCLQKLGKIDEAIASFLRSIIISPSYQIAIDDLKKLLEEEKIPEVTFNDYMKNYFNESELETINGLF